jgi:hypothetical protein
MTIANIPMLYHSTDRRNIAPIRELGGLYSLVRLNEIGVKIPVPGGNEWSHDADEAKGLGQFVHLCFRDKHPMEFTARKGGRIGKSIPSNRS